MNADASTTGESGDSGGNDWLTQLQQMLDLHRSGDPSARSRLVEWTERWQLAKVRSELNGFPALRRWYQTGDVMNELLMELNGELAKRQPASVREFLGLVNLLISRRLIDYWRSGFGKEGFAANHHSFNPASGGTEPGAKDADVAPGPLQSAETAERVVEILEAVEQLPDDQKQVVRLKYYEEMTLPEIARAMEISLSSVNRLLACARLFLTKELATEDEGDAA